MCIFQHIGPSVILNSDLLTPKPEAFSPKMHQCWKFGENMSNTFQDLVLTVANPERAGVDHAPLAYIDGYE